MKFFWLATSRAGGLVVTDDDGFVQAQGSCPYYARAYADKHLNDVIKAERAAKRTIAWMELEPHG
jgi:hypothetical protein